MDFQLESGDRTFWFYRHCILEWIKTPRWATIDRLYDEYLSRIGSLTAADRRGYDLAWQVFFALHVIPYEEKQREKNGEVIE